jgi:hypothetical protein
MNGTNRHEQVTRALNEAFDVYCGHLVAYSQQKTPPNAIVLGLSRNLGHMRAALLKQSEGFEGKTRDAMRAIAKAIGNLGPDLITKFYAAVGGAATFSHLKDGSKRRIFVVTSPCLRGLDFCLCLCLLPRGLALLPLPFAARAGLLPLPFAFARAGLLPLPFVFARARLLPLPPARACLARGRMWPSIEGDHVRRLFWRCCGSS